MSSSSSSFEPPSWLSSSLLNASFFCFNLSFALCFFFFDDFGRSFRNVCNQNVAYFKERRSQRWQCSVHVEAPPYLVICQDCYSGDGGCQHEGAISAQIFPPTDVILHDFMRVCRSTRQTSGQYTTPFNHSQLPCH